MRSSDPGEQFRFFRSELCRVIDQVGPNSVGCTQLIRSLTLGDKPADQYTRENACKQDHRHPETIRMPLSKAELYHHPQDYEPNHEADQPPAEHRASSLSFGVGIGLGGNSEAGNCLERDGNGFAGQAAETTLRTSDHGERSAQRLGHAVTHEEDANAGATLDPGQPVSNGFVACGSILGHGRSTPVEGSRAIRNKRARLGACFEPPSQH